MSVQFQNYDHSFKIKGKPVFAPSDLGRRIGEDVKDRVERAFHFEDHFYNLRKGGHVAALHAHRSQKYFAKFDIENFFYSIARNRVARSLRSISVSRARHYSKWSCVKNPYTTPSYALPYGFVQSSILAALVLAQSPLGDTLRQLAGTVTVAVYVDDISLSSNDLPALRDAFEEISMAFAPSSFNANDAKTVEPCEALSVFNCDLSIDSATVLPERIAEFYASPRSPASIAGFQRYVDSVVNGNGKTEI